MAARSCERFWRRLELDLGDALVERLALDVRELELERARLARAVGAGERARTPGGACIYPSAPAAPHKTERKARTAADLGQVRQLRERGRVAEGHVYDAHEAHMSGLARGRRRGRDAQLMPWCTKVLMLASAVASCPPPGVPVLTNTPAYLPASPPDAQRPPVASQKPRSCAGWLPYRVGTPRRKLRGWGSADARAADRGDGVRVVGRELVRGDDRVARLRGRGHLLQDLLRKGFLDPIGRLGAGVFGTLHDITHW